MTKTPLILLPGALSDDGLIAVIQSSAANVGPEAYIGQQKANMTRPDGRPSLK